MYKDQTIYSNVKEVPYSKKISLTVIVQNSITVEDEVWIKSNSTHELPIEIRKRGKRGWVWCILWGILFSGSLQG